MLLQIDFNPELTKEQKASFKKLTEALIARNKFLNNTRHYITGVMDANRRDSAARRFFTLKDEIDATFSNFVEGLKTELSMMKTKHRYYGISEAYISCDEEVIMVHAGISQITKQAEHESIQIFNNHDYIWDLDKDQHVCGPESPIEIDFMNVAIGAYGVAACDKYRSYLRDEKGIETPQQFHEIRRQFYLMHKGIAY